MITEAILLSHYPEFLRNKYMQTYIRLCNKRIETPPPVGVTVEKHHVIPKFVKPNIDILVSLTVREHVIAHLLLARMMPQNSMIRAAAYYALKAFTMSAGGARPERRIMSRAVEQYRRAFDNTEWREARNRKVSEGRLQPESNANIRKQSKAQWENSEYRDKVVGAIQDRWNDPVFKQATIAKIQSAGNRKLVSEKTKEAMAKPEVRAKYDAGYKASQEKRTSAITAAWADPVKKAARLEKIRKTKEAKRLKALQDAGT